MHRFARKLSKHLPHVPPNVPRQLQKFHHREQIPDDVAVAVAADRASVAA